MKKFLNFTNAEIAAACKGFSFDYYENYDSTLLTFTGVYINPPAQDYFSRGDIELEYTSFQKMWTNKFRIAAVFASRGISFGSMKCIVKLCNQGKVTVVKSRLQLIMESL